MGELLLDVFENSIGKSRGSGLVHEPQDAPNAGNFTSHQERPLLRIRVVAGHRNDPVVWQEGLVRDVTHAAVGGMLRRLGRGDTAHVFDHHSCHGLNGHNGFFVVIHDLDSDGIGPSRGVLHRHALVGKTLHFRLRPWILKGQPDQTLHVRNGVFVVGHGQRCRGFSHRSRLIKPHHVWVESLGVAIKNHIHTTTSSSGNGGILCTKVNSHDAHDVSFHTSLFAVVVSCGPT
mmetsp:Transcript_19093/g.34607  ORF Transcript_19093/g.34607 Transcript_19093/m.34607 type:complete len:232 (-) Transcript_19093:28-723(-)